MCCCINEFINYLRGFPWLSFLKGLAVLGAFAAFCISLRQKEYERFAGIKPVFEIISDDEKDEFCLVNFGGTVFYIGSTNDFRAKPKKSASLPTIKEVIDRSKIDGISTKLKFTCNENISTDYSCYLYFQDVDLNIYRITIGKESDGFVIKGIPAVKRSDKYYTIPWHWLDRFFNRLFKKEWFTEFETPTDTLI